MITTIFYYADKFCKYCDKEIYTYLLSTKKKKRFRKSRLSLSEIITICIYFHMSGYKTFKDYYEKHLLKELKGCFPLLVSYNRFLELKNEYAFPIIIFAMLMNSSQCTGITFVDSFPLRVCHNKRIYAHKTFKGFAKRVVSSKGWFFGFKIHVVINHLGEIMSFYLTPSNVHDANQNVMNKLTKKLWDKIFGDKGCIGADLFKMLWDKGMELITNIRKNMKERIIKPENKALLDKRGVVESVGNILKNSFSIEHSRHRSLIGFFVHICSGLLAYTFKEKKPSIAVPVELLS